MERDTLFKKIGFVKVGGCITNQHGPIFDNYNENSFEVDIWIYVDFKRKRVMIDEGDWGEPLFLKGSFMKKEIKEYKNYENSLDKEISKLFDKKKEKENVNS